MYTGVSMLVKSAAHIATVVNLCLPILAFSGINTPEISIQLKTLRGIQVRKQIILP